MSKLGHKKEESVKIDYKKIYEANKKVKTDPESMMYDLTDASCGEDSMGDEVYWRLDNFLDELKYAGRYSDISTWESYIEEEPERVEELRQYLTELYEDENCKGKFRSSIESTLNAIDAAQAGNAKAKAEAEAMKDPKNIVAAIKNIKGVTNAYQMGKNIWVDLDTEDEFEAVHIEGIIEADILHNGRQHGRDDLQGMGQWHLNVGTVAEYSEDSYNDLDPSVRDQYQIIIEPAESYKTRREMDW